MSNQQTIKDGSPDARELPVTVLLGEPIAAASQKDLDALDSQLNLRVAALFSDYANGSLLPDASNWAQATVELARAMCARHAPWIQTSLTDSGAWKISIDAAIEYVKGFKTLAAVEGRGVRALNDYKNNPRLHYETAISVEVVTGLKDNQVDRLLEYPNGLQYLFDWGEQQTAGSESLDRFVRIKPLAVEIWGGRLDDGQQKLKLRKLYDNLKPMRATLAEFAEKFPEAKQLKKQQQLVRKKGREQPGELRHILWCEDGYLPRKIRKSLESIGGDRERQQTIALICKRGRYIRPD